MLLICSALLNAQDRGTITGAVTDTSNASVGGAKVTLTNPSTGQQVAVVTNTEGTYTFLSLNAGRYHVVAEKEGFRKAEAANVVVQVNTTSRLDIQLQVGGLTETVHVESTTPLLQTERSDLGTVVDNKAIQQLPLFINGGLRSNLAFTSLAPGVTMNLTSDPDTTGGAPRIAGGQANGASLLLDGSESMSERRNDPQMRVVSAEAVEEFKVQTSAYSAEFGRASNGVLNYTTKSGTNALHGSGMVQLRHEKLNAQGFFWGTTARGESVRRQHVEAVNIGGPVYIPKVYDGRNKTFFFFAGERSRAKNYSSTGLQSMPIADFRNEWGIDQHFAHRGGLKPAREDIPARTVWLLQRKDTKVGAGLAKTTGWIRRTLLKKRHVAMIGGVDYKRIDDAGLHLDVDGAPQLLEVDTIVICAGQEPQRDLVPGLEKLGIRHTLIGGADVALELDAKRAIEQGTRVALAL